LTVELVYQIEVNQTINSKKLSHGAISFLNIRQYLMAAIWLGLSIGLYVITLTFDKYQEVPKPS